MELLELLNAPPREFTPIPFWFLNGDLKAEELRAQLKDFSDRGVYGVVLHPRMGLPKRIEYLSKTFFYYIRTAVQTAAELDMKIVLYDEGMYPSGSASGKVVEGHSELASEGIVLTDSLQLGDELLAETKAGFLAARKSGGTMRGLHWNEEDGCAGAPASADILNPTAVNRFISLTHEVYYRALGEYFGNTVIGFFTDEPSILGRNVKGMLPWTHGFAECFTKAGGNLSGLAALFMNEKNADTKLYEEMILKRECDVYYGKLSAWCEEHGIALMGHPHQSDDIEVQRYFHIPGQDLVLRWLGPEKSGIRGIDSTMAKCSADAAYLNGRRRNANECFGACNENGNPWQLSGGDIKWYIDWLAVRGVNLFIPHAFYYSIAGKRKLERPPDVGPNSIWWKYYNQWSNYMRRLSCLMTDVELIAPVAVLCRNRELCPDTVAELFEKQIGFRYIPENVWAEYSQDLETHELICKGHRYKVVLGDNEKRFDMVPDVISGELSDCQCSPSEPFLRCAHFLRKGTECWFFVNEGNETVETMLTLRGADFVGEYNLWTGQVRRKASMNLKLAKRESVLLFSCGSDDYAALSEPQEEYILPKPDFKLIEHNAAKCTKIYRADMYVSTRQWQQILNKIPVLLIDGEEMAELSVNGSSLAASFWSPHRFELGGMLHEGKNELTLIMTGSLANKYGSSQVFYGLR